MLITVPCRPLSELLQAPDHCSVLGEVNFTNCPLAGRVVIGIRMGIVRPEQAKLQEPLGAFGKRVAGVALLPGGRCPCCTSSMIKCTSASPASAHHVRNKIKALARWSSAARLQCCTCLSILWPPILSRRCRIRHELFIHKPCPLQMGLM